MWHWELNAQTRFYYRDRNHQYAQLWAAVEAAGPLEGKRVLDVGCGYGDLLGLLPPCSYLGIDVNPLAVEQARRLWPDHTFRVSDRPRRSDVVIAVATLQACDDRAGALRSWIRAARETLVVVTCVPGKLPADEQGEAWWEGIEREVVESGDDFLTYVVRKVSHHEPV